VDAFDFGPDSRPPYDGYVPRRLHRHGLEQYGRCGTQVEAGPRALRYAVRRLVRSLATNPKGAGAHDPDRPVDVASRPLDRRSLRKGVSMSLTSAALPGGTAGRTHRTGMSRVLVNGASVLLGLALTVPAGATSSRMPEARVGAGTGSGAASPTSPSQSSPSATIGSPADDGARIIRVVTIDDRTRDLLIESPAVGTVPVRLLLPRTFDAQDADRYPALYLLHGGGGEYTDWTQQTSVEAVAAPTDLLVVMPAAASSRMFGWEPDSSPDPLGGRVDWETFHLTELPQLMERNFRASDERAIGGLSLGGYGAVMYAARHPGLFRAVASYSGVLDVTARSDIPPEAQAIIESAQQLGAAAGWGQVNPIELVPSLQGTPLYISYGNGVPGPLDPAGTDPDELEAWVGAGDDNFVAALREAGIAATVNAYGPGTHSWGYWDRELGASLPTLLAALGEPAPGPPWAAPS